MTAVRTILALVLAVGLVGGALYVRTRFIEVPDTAVDGDGTPAGNGVPGSDPAGGEEIRIACDELLGSACPPGSTTLDTDGLLDAFATTPVSFDVLLAPSAVVELIRESQTSRATFAEPIPVATTPVVLAVATTRGEAVAEVCGPAVTWTCTAELIRQGQLSPSFADPQSTTLGLAAFAATTGGFLGRPDFRTNDLGGTDFITWLDAVRGQVRTMPDPLRALILFGGADNDSAITTEADALDTVARAATNVPDLHWPTPVAHLTAVVAPVQGVAAADVEATADGAAQALTEAGWRDAEGAPPQPAGSVPTPPPIDLAAPGLPSGGVLFTLRGRWG